MCLLIIKVLIYSCNSNLTQLSLADSRARCFHNYPKILAKSRMGKTRCQQLKRLNNTGLGQSTQKPRSKGLAWFPQLCAALQRARLVTILLKRPMQNIKVSLLDSESIMPIPRSTKLQRGPNPHLHYCRYYREPSPNKPCIQQNLFL